MKALEGLDAALEHRVRLAIAVLLARHGEISFARFKQQLELTDGNLGAQLRKLEDVGYLALRRDFADRKPVTWYSLTDAGRAALERHLQALQHVIAQATGTPMA
ncbi:transcriptional regulator [Aerolutibacter ruishenii]|uniref:Winged helix DNA-binding protein n=1 Tax=Aerolutibacter ruishenii TaxID=686800 RepID=A0A562M465_9GAMM|nr:transcriptional regulator [Lysobacter ruishenii]TWI14381.1 winged helix DNA-binding protein [Lysobacter ruishenii]